MWKIFVAFLAFALLALFVIMKGGSNVDMMGEAGHGTPSSSAPADSTPAAPAAPAVSSPATEPAPATAAPAASK